MSTVIDVLVGAGVLALAVSVIVSGFVAMAPSGSTTRRRDRRIIRFCRWLWACIGVSIVLLFSYMIGSMVMAGHSL